MINIMKQKKSTMKDGSDYAVSANSINHNK